MEWLREVPGRQPRDEGRPIFAWVGRAKLRRELFPALAVMASGERNALAPTTWAVRGPQVEPMPTWHPVQRPSPDLLPRDHTLPSPVRERWQSLDTVRASARQ